MRLLGMHPVKDAAPPAGDARRRAARRRRRGARAALAAGRQVPRLHDPVALAYAEAMFVARLRTWLKLGYRVRKGEKAIRIMAPMPSASAIRRPARRPTRRACCSRRCPSLIAARSTLAFRHADAARAAVRAADRRLPSPPARGAPGVRDARVHGRLVDPGAAGGWCDSNAKRIVVDAERRPTRSCGR